MAQAPEDQVLYLFGAGASANAIPVINGIPDDMKEVADKLEEWHKEHEHKIEYKSIKERVKIIVSSLRELAVTVKGSGNGLTVDEYISSLEKGSDINPTSHDECQKSKNTLATYLFIKAIFLMLIRP